MRKMKKWLALFSACAMSISLLSFSVSGENKETDIKDINKKQESEAAQQCEAMRSEADIKIAENENNNDVCGQALLSNEAKKEESGNENSVLVDQTEAAAPAKSQDEEASMAGIDTACISSQSGDHSNSDSDLSETICSDEEDATAYTESANCIEYGETGNFDKGYKSEEITWTTYKRCKGHIYQWVITKQAAVGVAGSREYRCTVCGAVNATETIPALTEAGQETPWVYTDSTHRHKTMYDGTVINEELVVVGNYSVWGYFDDEAASAMNEAVNYMLVHVKGWNPFNVSSAYYDNARRNAAAYAIKGSSTKAYHANFGGLPNVDDNKRYITLMDGYNADNYIGCFVKDGYQENGDYTYGQHWRSWFGTYYASGSF